MPMPVGWQHQQDKEDWIKALKRRLDNTQTVAGSGRSGRHLQQDVAYWCDSSRTAMEHLIYTMRKLKECSLLEDNLRSLMTPT